ncbi:MAG: hypothetical protein HY301_08845 [Verrucomicrobia bacterium]|nr:hypothetical protein [Verrucomicrobiota bacterium]
MTQEAFDIANLRAVCWLIGNTRSNHGLFQEKMSSHLGIADSRYYQDLEYGLKHPGLELFLRVFALALPQVREGFMQQLRWHPVPPSDGDSGSQIKPFA